jgi:hypothetical protein
VANDVDHLAIWVTDEESPDAPHLVGDRVHDLCATRAYRLVGGVDVIDLDAEVRVDGAAASLVMRMTWAVGLDRETRLTTHPRFISSRNPRTW